VAEVWSKALEQLIVDELEVALQKIVSRICVQKVFFKSIKNKKEEQKGQTCNYCSILQQLACVTGWYCVLRRFCDGDGSWSVGGFIGDSVLPSDYSLCSAGVYSW